MESPGIFEPVPLPDDAGVMALYDWSELEREHGNKYNLVCLNSAGVIRWKEELPAYISSDRYVAFRLESGVILANTFSCFLITLGPETGKILSRKFVK